MEPAPGTRIVRILGIPIYLHSSWFIIFALITLSLGTQFTAQHPTWSPSQHWALGIITSLFFFASVLIHELGHSVIAKHYKIPVDSITLFIFGGMAKIPRDPEKPIQEFNIAIAGPITSFLLAGAFYLVYLSTPKGGMLSAASSLLAEINAYLGLFNLVPGLSARWRPDSALDRLGHHPQFQQGHPDRSAQRPNLRLPLNDPRHLARDERRKTGSAACGWFSSAGS